MKSRALVQNLALSALSVAFVFAVCEVAVRLLVSKRGGKEQREAFRYATYDPVLGWRKTPGSEVTFSRPDFVTTFRINSQGLRDRERPVAKPSGEFRVVALGDSFIEAYTVGDADMPTVRLREELAAGGCAVDVINGGTFGYSTDQEYLAYDRDLYRYQPDVVVLFVYHNDIPPLLWGPDKPVLDFSTEPPRVSNEPVKSRFSIGPPPVTGPRPETASFFRSQALTLLRARLDRTPPWIRDRLEKLGLVPPILTFGLNDEMFLYARQPPEHLLRAIKAFQQTIGALNRRTARDGARLLVAYIPARFEVNADDWERTQTKYQIGTKWFDRRSLVFRLMTAAFQEGVEFVDLSDAIKAAQGFFSSPYLDNDNHWNARGSAVGARAVASKLQQLRWAPNCGPSR